MFKKITNWSLIVFSVCQWFLWVSINSFWQLCLQITSKMNNNKKVESVRYLYFIASAKLSDGFFEAKLPLQTPLPSNSKISISLSSTPTRKIFFFWTESVVFVFLKFFLNMHFFELYRVTPLVHQNSSKNSQHAEKPKTLWIKFKRRLKILKSLHGDRQQNLFLWGASGQLLFICKGVFNADIFVLFSCFDS